MIRPVVTAESRRGQTLVPRYLVETAAVLAGAVELDAQADRLPELAIERAYLTRDGGGERLIGMCRAPSEAHVRRWLASP